MATWYVNSAAAGTGAGTSWVNACTTMAAAIALSAAGDDFNVLSTHTETFGVNTTLTFKGTAAAPNRVFSCGNTNAPATASDLTAGASLATSGAFTLTLDGYAYFYGFTITCGSGANGPTLTMCSGSSRQVYDTCAVVLGGTSAQSMQIGTASAGNEVVWLNTTYQVSAAGTKFKCNGSFLWTGPSSAHVGATIPTTLFGPSTNSAGVVLDGVDLHLLAGASTLVGSGTGSRNPFTLINCRLSASLLAVAATPTGPGFNPTFLIDCDSGTVNYRLEKYDYPGTQTTDAVHVKTALAGASDGTTPVSHKVVTTANANRQTPFQLIDVVAWVDTTGTSKTATFEVLTDNVILTNADIWVEANYEGNASYPQASIATSGPATQLTAGSNLATSTGGTAGAAATWVTTGFGSGGVNAKPQSMAVTFTTQLKGPVRFRIKVAKPSLTVYVDPFPTIV